jgi:hypothetical protein
MVGCGSSSSDSDTKKVGSLSITVENSDALNDLRVQILDTEDRLIWDEYFERDEKKKDDMPPLEPGDYKVRVFEVKKYNGIEHTKRFGTSTATINGDNGAITVSLGDDILKPNSDSDPWEGICYDSENSQLKFSWSMSETEVKRIVDPIDTITYRLYIYEENTPHGEPNLVDNVNYKGTYNSEINGIFEADKYYDWYVRAEIEADTQTFRFVSNDYNSLNGTEIHMCIDQERCSENGPPECNSR